MMKAIQIVNDVAQCVSVRSAQNRQSGSVSTCTKWPVVQSPSDATHRRQIIC